MPFIRPGRDPNPYPVVMIAEVLAAVETCNASVSATTAETLAAVDTCSASMGYTTSFPGTENPISESGAWTSGGINPPRTNVQTGGGLAFGTMSSFDGTNFADSIACLSGFGPDQQITATLSNSSAVSGQEIELVLRMNLSSSSNTGYEVDLFFGGGTVSITRWNGPDNNFTTVVAGTATNVSFADGAVWFASIVGTMITVKCNGALVISYDTSVEGASKITSGNPGIGFWNQTGNASLNPNFAWSDFSAVGL